MPQFERDPGIVAYEAFAGLRNDVPAYRFEMTDLAVGTNVDIDDTGAISRRAGFTQARAGASHSLWADGSQLALFVEGTSLKQLTAGYGATTLRTGLTAGLRMSYCKVNDRVYFSNGAQTGVWQDGVVRSWGLEVPTLPAVAATVGDMPAGDYQYAMVYVRDDGQQSGAPLAGRITLAAGGGITFTMPVSSDPGVVAKDVFVSSTNGDVLYYAFTASNATVTAASTANPNTLSSPLDSQFLCGAPAGHLVGHFRGHMFVAVGDTLFYSEPLSYEQFDLRKFISFDSKITMFAAVEDRENPGIYIGTETSTGWISGKVADSFEFVPTVDYGAILGAQTYVDGAVFADHSSGARMLPMWLSTQGLCVGLPGGAIQNLTRSKYTFTAQGSGCALFKPDTTQVIAVVNS